MNSTCVITVSGAANVGKTTILNQLIDLFGEEYPIYDITEQVNVPPQDRLVYFGPPNGPKCGISTCGDTLEYVRESLHLLKEEYGCDFFVTATRARRSQSFLHAEAIANTNKYDFIPIIKSGSGLDPYIDSHTDNNLHYLLFDLIQQRISIFINGA